MLLDCTGTHVLTQGSTYARAAVLYECVSERKHLKFEIKSYKLQLCLENVKYLSIPFIAPNAILNHDSTLVFLLNLARRSSVQLSTPSRVLE